MTRKMKDSGVEWIGKIPEEWEIVKIKHIKSKEKNSFVDGPFGSNLKSEHFVDNGDVYVIESNFATKGKLVEEELKTITLEHFYSIERSETREGDIIIAKIGENYGSARVLPHINKIAVVSGNSLKLTVDKDIANIDYICYCLSSMKDNSVFKLLVNSTGQPALSLGGINNIKLALPKLKEQNRIGEFLKSNCNKIDKTIEKEKQVIEKLKEYKQSVITEAVTKGLNPDVPMKDSGVEWIGEIPKSWSVVKLKQIFSFKKGLSITKDNLVEEGIKVISYGQIHSKSNTGVCLNDSLIKYVGDEYLETGIQCLVSKNDFIFADTSEDLEGAGNYVYIDLNEVIFAGYHTIILTPINNEVMSEWKYLAYLYKTDCWRSQIRSRVSGIKLFSITQKILKQTEVIIPDSKEQQRIVNYLDKKCSAIDKLILTKEKVIEKLTEYKKSLIYECVTGKREVQ